MATPAQIRQAVDDRLAALWSAIQTKEAAYAAAHGGRYWQGRRTHSVIPADGGAALPDIGVTTPTDQPDPWPAALRQVAMEMALQIETYDGPAGVGYAATVFVRINGVVWERAAQVGPETWRQHGWRQSDLPP